MEIVIWIVMCAAIYCSFRFVLKEEAKEKNERPWYEELIEEMAFNCSHAKASGDCWHVHHAKHCQSCDIILYCKTPKDFNEQGYEHKDDDFVVHPEFDVEGAKA